MLKVVDHDLSAHWPDPNMLCFMAFSKLEMSEIWFLSLYHMLDENKTFVPNVDNLALNGLQRSDVKSN